MISYKARYLGFHGVTSRPLIMLLWNLRPACCDAVVSSALHPGGLDSNVGQELNYPPFFCDFVAVEP
jgi:hypothetical protein